MFTGKLSALVSSCLSTRKPVLSLSVCKLCNQLTKLCSGSDRKGYNFVWLVQQRLGCIGGMHISILTLDYCIEVMHLSILDCCIGGMHLSTVKLK